MALISFLNVFFTGLDNCLISVVPSGPFFFYEIFIKFKVFMLSMISEVNLEDEKKRLVDHWAIELGLNEIEKKAFMDVKREGFIGEGIQRYAYVDRPLPILRGKTISQPSTVMIMTHALKLEKGHKVFEVGTGSGYQTAILSSIVGEEGSVISTEVIPELVMYSKERLASFLNVEIYEEDGSRGMSVKSPFDRVIITAACKEIPPVLIEQMKVGGIIIAPVGEEDTQYMTRGVKQEDGTLKKDYLGPFVFSSLYGKYGFEV